MATPTDPTTTRSTPHRAMRAMTRGVLAGGFAGFLWGGVGGRLAMRIVFLTSDPRVAGLKSDDGFVIGQISSDTMFLVMFTTMIGGIVGLAAGLVRSWMRSGTMVTASAFAVAGAFFGGGNLVHADGIDFRLLDPLALTVGLFMLIPAGWAATVVILMDRWQLRGSWIDRLPLPMLVVPVLVVLAIGDGGGPALIVLLLLGVIGMLVVGARSRRIPFPWLRHVGNLVAWVILAGVTALGAMDLAHDLAALT